MRVNFVSYGRGKPTTFPDYSSSEAGHPLVLHQKSKSDILSVSPPPPEHALVESRGTRPPPERALKRHNRSKGVYDDLGFWGIRNFTIQIFENF